MNDEEIDGSLVLRKSDWLEDWYTIERASHENVQRMEECPDLGPNAMSLYDSGRVSDACVEGSLAEMRGLAERIQTRGRYYAKRCAVDASRERVYFWSPRNSRSTGSVTHEVAEALAAQILSMPTEPT